MAAEARANQYTIRWSTSDAGAKLTNGSNGADGRAKEQPSSLLEQDKCIPVTGNELVWHREEDRIRQEIGGGHVTMSSERGVVNAVLKRTGDASDGKE